jgi:UDP-glucose 4-epimerase
MNAMSKKTLCVVLGGKGFLGRRLCRAMLEAGFRIRSISRSGMPDGQPETWWSDVEWISASLGTESCALALQEADLLVHLASTTLPSTSNSDIAYDLESNVVGTIKTLEAASVHGVRRTVFVSSGGTVYGPAREIPIAEHHPTEPICSYGIHKLAIEKYLQLFRSQNRLDSIVLRVSNMYGESQGCGRPLGAIAHFAAHAVEGTPIQIWGDGTVTRDYVYVDDVVSAILKSAAYEGTERMFNIGSGRGTSLNEILDMIRLRLQKPVIANYQPPRGFDVPENILDSKRAKCELGWRPEVSLETGLDRMIRSVQSMLAARV